MKILVLGRNQLYKRSLGRELFKQDLSKFHNVIYYGKGYRKYYVKNVPDILKTYNDRDFIERVNIISCLLQRKAWFN